MKLLNTFYASPERATQEILENEISFVSESPLVSGLLQTVSGLLAVVNEHRQIVALNNSFLQLLGIDDPTEALGLRPGEALRCVHAHEEPAGCGTSRFCETCGAAIAMVTSLDQNAPTERICALTTKRGVTSMDLSLLVRSHPILIRGRRFLLLMVQDITLQQHRAALERTFFHDITNMVAGIMMTCQMLQEEQPSELTELVTQTAVRLHKEIEIQQSLLGNDAASYEPMWDEIPVTRILSDLERFFTNHPTAKGKKLILPASVEARVLWSDTSALSRVLANMIINAFEATEPGGTVRVSVKPTDDAVTFTVWNAGSIPEDVARRIFQRNFSTKDQDGRGIGTFSMKLFGEKILGGQVGFSSSEEEGTCFWLRHPA